MTSCVSTGNLVKSQQCSSWGTRPLSEGQIHYAACDALVLLRLYDALCGEVDELFGGSVDVMDVLMDVEVSLSSVSSQWSLSPRAFRQTPSARRRKGSPESCRSLQLL